MTMTARISSDGPHVALKSRQQISSNYNPHANSHDQQQHIDKLITLYEKEHLTNLTLRETVRRLRQEKTLTTRQVALANRTIERLAIDRGTTEAQDAAKDACIRRLETQVAVLGKRGQLNEAAEEMSCEMAERVVRLELEVEAGKAGREALEKSLRDLEEENRKLKRAVQVASEVRVAAEGENEEREAMHKENTNKLLLAVAKAQEEAIGLAKELAVAKNEKETMEAALKTARDHLTKQHDALQRWKEFESSHVKKERSLVDEVAALKEVVSGMDGERKAKRQLEEKVRELVGMVEIEKTRRMEAEARLKVAMEMGEVTARGLVVAADNEAGVGGDRVDDVADNLSKKNNNDAKDGGSTVVDLNVTLAGGPTSTSRPTLFDLANMQVS